MTLDNNTDSHLSDDITSEPTTVRYYYLASYDKYFAAVTTSTWRREYRFDDDWAELGGSPILGWLMTGEHVDLDETPLPEGVPPAPISGL